MADETQQGAAWSAQINLAGVGFFDPTSFEEVPAGPYKTTITGSTREASKSGGADNLVLEVWIAEGADKGVTQRVWISLDPTNEVAKKHLKNVLSTVSPKANLEQPGTIGPQTFLGKDAYLYVQLIPEGSRKKGTNKSGKEVEYAYNRSFITTDMYKKLSAAGPAGATAQGGAQ